MAIQKRFIHFKKFSDFNKKKLSANETNTQYTVGVSGEIQNGEPDVLYQSYCWIKDTKQQWTHGTLYDGNYVFIDDILSDDGENPVKGRVIKEYIDLHPQYESIDEIEAPDIELPMIECDAALSNTSIKPVQNRVVTQVLATKVDKVPGKQLSTEDFTTDLKARLLALTNYDDTAINNAVKSLESRFNTLVNGDPTSAIDSYNNIIAFLDNISDSETLEGIIASIEQQIAAVRQSIPDTSSFATKDELNSKQNILVSGTNIKTINGENILGSGNVEINIDTTNLATKAELNAKQDKISDLNVIRQGAILGGTALQSVPDEYITENDLNSKGYITQTQLVNKQDTIDDLEEIRQGAYLGKTALQEEVFKGTVTGVVVNEELKPQSEAGVVNIGSVLTEHQDVSHLTTKEELNAVVTEILNNEEVTAAALTDLNEKKADKEYVEDALKNMDTSSLVSKEELEALRNEVITNEEIVASSLNDLEDRKASKEYVEDALGNVSVDTSTLVTKDEFTDVEEVWAASYNLLNQKISNVQQYIYDEAASRRQFDEAIAEIQSILLENEAVVTTAWNQLNTRIIALEAAQAQGE